MGGTFRGHEGMLKMIQAFGGDAWEGWEILPVTVIVGVRSVVVSDRPGWFSGWRRADSDTGCRLVGLTCIGCVARRRPRIAGVT
jgi:hypothetical protein